MNLKCVEPTQQHRDFREAMLDVFSKHGQTMSAVEMLAIAAQLVGQLIAVQDQTKMSPREAIALVMSNVEEGNQHAVAELAKPAH